MFVYNYLWTLNIHRFFYEALVEFCRQGEIKALIEAKNLFQNNFVHHKSHTDWPEIETRPPRFRTKNELYVKIELGPHSKHTQLQISIRCREITPVFFLRS